MAKDTDRVVTLDDAPKNKAVAGQQELAPLVAESVVAGRNHDEALCGKRISVTFYEQDTDLGKLPVTVGLNGITYQMPRNVPCNIPVEVLGVIKDAVEDVYEANGGAVVKRLRPRFSYQVHA